MIGERCFIGDQPGTIRWIGYLDGLESERIGVELDTSSSDRHNGEYRGQFVFECLPGCGVFVKRSKLSFSVKQAMHLRYQSSLSQEDVCTNLIGYQKIQNKISDLTQLSFACLEKSQISTSGDLTAFQNLTRLRLSDNAIGNFSVGLSIHRNTR